jgi:alkylhydroperoxidase family enzyme
MRIDLPDSQRDNPLANLSKNYAPSIVDAAFAFSAVTYQDSKLSLREFEGARARTAEINGCQICQGWRSARDLPGYFSAFGGKYENSVAANGTPPDEAYYKAVSEWRTSPIYTERERLAIEYAEGLGLDPRGIAVNDEFWRSMRAAFSNDEIVDLSYCIACWMGLGRIVHALGMDAACSIRAPEADLAA